jgi:D-inositol-3-phosphate glycosyltransferase
MLYPNDRFDEFMNSFIVFNGNRNQPRKKIEHTMWAFKEFSKDKDDVKLYLHMGILDAGVNIVELASRYGFLNKLILTTLTPEIPNVPDERLNLIYNATDVGINTSMGEGWGLVNWEHGMAKKPQIVPDYSATKEVWTKGAVKIPAAMPGMMERVNTKVT